MAVVAALSDVVSRIRYVVGDVGETAHITHDDILAAHHIVELEGVVNLRKRLRRRPVREGEDFVVRMAFTVVDPDAPLTFMMWGVRVTVQPVEIGEDTVEQGMDGSIVDIFPVVFELRLEAVESEARAAGVVRAIVPRSGEPQRVWCIS